MTRSDLVSRLTERFSQLTHRDTEFAVKTILDAMFPAAEALARIPSGPERLDAAIEAADRGVTTSKELQSRRGRASWLQDRSIGLQDPGATAYLRFLQSWKSANAPATAAVS